MPATLQRRVWEYVRAHQLLRAGDRVGVAVSGGVDSVALLRLLLDLRADLGLVLSVVHFNHRIRGAEADADEQFVRVLAERFELPFLARSGDVPAHARTAKLSLETAARQLRYAYFRDLCGSGTVTSVATGHTLDDQAETVLLRFVRGAWTRGLAGIYPKLEFTHRDEGKEGAKGEVGGAVVRPLLQVRRAELEQYLRSLGQDWREDVTNRDLKHARNRIRHELLPLLEGEYNPGIRGMLAELAEIARAEEAYWREEIAGALGSVVHTGLALEDSRANPPSLRLERHAAGGPTSELSESPPTGPQVHLRADALAKLPVAVQRRVLRHVMSSAGLDFQHVEQVLRMVRGSDGAAVELRWPWRVRRVARCPDSMDRAQLRAGPELVFDRTDLRGAGDYEYVLPVPGEVSIPEIGKVLSASMVDPKAGAEPGYNHRNLLNPLALGPAAQPGCPSQLLVRNWRPGDRFWPAHTKSPKKVKELLQAGHISGLERRLWTVVVNAAGELVWMRGFGVPQGFAAAENAGEGILIRESGSEAVESGLAT